LIYEIKYPLRDAMPRDIAKGQVEKMEH